MVTPADGPVACPLCGAGRPDFLERRGNRSVYLCRRKPCARHFFGAVAAGEPIEPPRPRRRPGTLDRRSRRPPARPDADRATAEDLATAGSIRLAGRRLSP